MKNTNPFYITTTLPYVNSSPHLGYAMEVIRADALARFNLAQGKEVFFNYGTDEHGTKIHQAAQEAGEATQDYVDRFAKTYLELKETLGLWEGATFIRTTDEHHKNAAIEFWNKCMEAGYIYKKSHTGLYCVGCELYKTEKDLVEGECDVHPGKKLVEVSEENYFFAFSKFEQKLLDYYKENPDFVVPNFRFNEIRTFVENGLEDFSISRQAHRMPWGIPVPGDDSQVMYVWFDALVNYIATLGWPDESGDFAKFWPGVQIAGKDNLRQQSAIWQAMLMSVDIEPSRHILINGFLNASDGMKMSKSRGNVIAPDEIIARMGVDALRFIVLKDFSQFEDSDVSLEHFEEQYTAHLVNGIGNLTNRIMKMAETHVEAFIVEESEYAPGFAEAMEKFHIKNAAEIAFAYATDIDVYIAETEPFKKVKEDKEEAQKIISELVQRLANVAKMLTPLMPQTAEQIQTAITNWKKPKEPLFERLEEKK